MTRTRAFVLAGRRLADRRFNTLKRRLGIGNYWTWMDPADVPETIETMSLIFPLRYDVMVRKGFFDMYQELDQLGAARHEILTAARASDYFEWFRHIMIRRNAPQLLNDPSSIDVLFDERVERNIQLFESLRTDGFNTRFPIVPYAARTIVRSQPTRGSSGQFYAGDGCHRIAALMTLGYEQLPRSFVKPKLFNRLTPLDNTALIAEVIDVPEGWL